MALASIADLNGDPIEIADKIDIVRQLSNMYDDLLENYSSEDEKERKPGVHASELNSCIRKVYYSLTMLKKKSRIAAVWQKRFQVGHALHSMVQKQFHKMAGKENAKKMADNLALENGWHLTFEDEVEVAPGKQELATYYKLESSCDGVFTFREGGPDGPIALRVGLEIKTESPDGYEKLKEPKADHVKQAHLYMAALDLPLIWFFYFNKGNQNNTQSSAPWIVVFTPSIWEALRVRAVTALEAAAQGIEPSREEGVYCQFCPYSWHCQPAAIRQSTGGNRRFKSVRRTGI